MAFLPPDMYARIEQSMPIACVDFAPILDGRIGLILRDSPFGEVWCHLGGRVLRGETLAQALQRHAHETLGTALLLDSDPQPAYVYQWFPPEIMPNEGGPHGVDPRKHSIGLAFVADLKGDPVAQGEGLRFAFFDPHALPSPLWPGCETLLARMGLIHQDAPVGGLSHIR